MCEKHRLWNQQLICIKPHTIVHSVKGSWKHIENGRRHKRYIHYIFRTTQLQYNKPQDEGRRRWEGDVGVAGVPAPVSRRAARAQSPAPSPASPIWTCCSVANTRTKENMTKTANGSPITTAAACVRDTHAQLLLHVYPVACILIWTCSAVAADSTERRCE